MNEVTMIADARAKAGSVIGKFPDKLAKIEINQACTPRITLDHHATR